MRKTLYLKFLLAYLIFGFFGFIVVATFGSSMTLEHMKREKADTLYKEATLIANTYASDLYNNEASLETVKIQLDSLAVYLDSTIWIINPSGRMIMDTNTLWIWIIPVSWRALTLRKQSDPIIQSVIFSTALIRKC